MVNGVKRAYFYSANFVDVIFLFSSLDKTKCIKVKDNRITVNFTAENNLPFLDM